MSVFFFFFKQKAANEIEAGMGFRRVLFRSRSAIPEIAAYGSHTAGSGGPLGPSRGVFPPGQRSFTPSAVCPSCLHRFCCRVAVDRPRVPLPVAVTLNYLTRSGSESEIVRIGVSLVAPFRESGQLRSHDTPTARSEERR